MKLLVCLVLWSCAATAPAIADKHPANPKAPSGRLAPVTLLGSGDAPAPAPAPAPMPDMPGMTH